ncbi:MAG: nucleotidyltransferase domain-containing protein [Gemmatimonadota bacterium]
MEHLHERIAPLVAEWRASGYDVEDYPAIAEILDYQTDAESGSTRFLRQPQLRALETYWYLRLVEGTPRVIDLYRKLYTSNTEKLEALGLLSEPFTQIVMDQSLDDLFDRIESDDELVRTHHLEALRETLTLSYPSYILALAMGAGKTILIGAIIATEFAMATEYPDGDFVQNALVFAPGKTILEALRELANMSYERVLPPRFYNTFAATTSLTFTRDGDPDIPVIRGSRYNVVVTNTEKIRIQKEAITRGLLGTLFSGARDDQARQDVANRRLQAIASLPHLAVFSDEAHHTYGQSLLGRWDTDAQTDERVFKPAGIKKVRRTVDYLAEQTNVICVVNTTGTPYFQKQPLKDVVIWYGLSEGIRDGILKEVGDNIFAYELKAGAEDDLVRDIVTTFFQTYGDTRLPDGSAAKLALYFPQNDDLRELRPAVESALAQLGMPATIVLRNTSESPKEEETAFNRLNDPNSPHRVILLVNKGTEGWNSPSLFACGLVRRLTSSNNFVLQAATRCLRQVPGNNQPARIYLTAENRNVLDKQLRDTYGESLTDLQRSPRERRSALLTLRKTDVPPIVVNRTVQRIVRQEPAEPLKLKRPVHRPGSDLERTALTLVDDVRGARLLQALGSTVSIETMDASLDLRSAAVRLAAECRAELWTVYDQLVGIYGEGCDVPSADLSALAEQVQRTTGGYAVQQEIVESALAVVRLETNEGGRARGWRTVQTAEGETVYVTEITYFRDREQHLLRLAQLGANPFDYGFHYDPYNFDSAPEQDFFKRMLVRLGQHPSQIEDIYFTGALTDPHKTDFFIEYKDADDRWRRYSPDFIIRRKDGLCLIVEIKREHDRDHPIDGANGRKANALRKLTDLNPDRIGYHMVFVDQDIVPLDALTQVIKQLGLAAGERLGGPRPEQLAKLCERWKITELAVFGSAARDEAGPDSDLDLLVSFSGDAARTILDLPVIESELSVVFGRMVDLVERAALDAAENPIRRSKILRESRVLFGG